MQSDREGQLQQKERVSYHSNTELTDISLSKFSQSEVPCALCLSATR